MKQDLKSKLAERSPNRPINPLLVSNNEGVHLKKPEEQSELSSSTTLSKPKMGLKEGKLNDNPLANSQADDLKRPFYKPNFRVDQKFSNVTGTTPIITKTVGGNPGGISRPESKTAISKPKEIETPFRIKPKQFDANVVASTSQNAYTLGQKVYEPVIHKIEDDNKAIVKPDAVSSIRPPSRDPNSNGLNSSNTKLSTKLKDKLNAAKPVDPLEKKSSQSAITNAPQKIEAKPGESIKVEQEEDEYGESQFDCFDSNKKSQPPIVTAPSKKQDSFNEKPSKVVPKEFSEAKMKQLDRLSKMKKLVELTSTYADIYNYNSASSSLYNSAQPSKSKPKVKVVDHSTNTEAHEIDKLDFFRPGSLAVDDIRSEVNISLRDPLSGDFYKYLLENSPYIETIIQSNINKEILTKVSTEKDKQKTSLKEVFKEFEFSKAQQDALFMLAKILLSISNTDKFDFLIKYIQCDQFENSPQRACISFSVCYTELGNLPKLKSSNAKTLYRLKPIYSGVIVVNLLSTAVEKTFFSFSEISNFVIEGAGEDKLLCGTTDGNFLLLSIPFSREDNCLNIGSLKQLSQVNCEDLWNDQLNLGIDSYNENSIFYLPKSKISLDSRIHKVIKNKWEIGRNYFVITDNNVIVIPDIQSMSSAGEIESRFEVQNLYKENFKRILDQEQSSKIGIISDFQQSKSGAGYILSDKHFAHLDFSSGGATTINYNIINLNEDRENIRFSELETQVQCFCVFQNDLSLNLLLTVFKDNCVRLYEEGSNSTGKVICLIEAYSGHAQGDNKLVQPLSSIINCTVSYLICKDNVTGGLVRNPCLSNFFMTSKLGELIIFDLNQDRAKTKKVKKIISLQKQNSKCTNLRFGNTSFIDYSNIIISIEMPQMMVIEQTSSPQTATGSIRFHKLSLRDKYFELSKIRKLNQEILAKLKGYK